MMSVQRLIIGEFLGVPLIPMVMETAQIVPGPIVRCQKSASSQPLTRVSPTTNAPLLTMMDIPGAIQLMVDGEIVTGAYVKWKKMNVSKAQY